MTLGILFCFTLSSRGKENKDFSSNKSFSFDVVFVCHTKPLHFKKINTMKKILAMSVLASLLAVQVNAQKPSEDKSKRPSPPAKVTAKIPSGATLIIDYSQPSIKGRTIGKNLDPMEGEIWRTGANEATVFETDKDVMVNGNKLPAGKYSLFTIFNGKDVTVIFNKVWNQWGAFKYQKSDDQLRVRGKYLPENPPAEKMFFTINPKGKVVLHWGDRKVSFLVK